jgi:glycosyltransferase involved in cell wall biosynthesis
VRARDPAADGDDPLSDVCVVTHPLGSAGENATRTLLEVLSALVSVSLVTAALPADSAVRERHEVVELPTPADTSHLLRSALGFVLTQLRMCRAIARRDESVVLFFGATAYLAPIVVARLLGRTVLLEPRGDVPLSLRLRWERRVPAPLARLLAGSVALLERVGFAVASGVVTYTPSMAEELGLNPEAPDVHPNGARYVDTERFDVRTPYEERGRVVGYVGRLDEEKGIRQLAAVARRLPDDITFRFVGDGGLRDWLAAELDDEITAGRVELAGWVDHDEVPAELDRLRLLVMPSRPTEGLPTTILEAMACGTPAYATPVAGIPTVVRDGETGYLLRADDPAAIAARIERILDADDAAAVSRQARDLAVSEYSFDAAVRRYEAILRAAHSM